MDAVCDVFVVEEGVPQVYGSTVSLECWRLYYVIYYFILFLKKMGMLIQLTSNHITQQSNQR